MSQLRDSSGVESASTLVFANGGSASAAAVSSMRSGLLGPTGTLTTL